MNGTITLISTINLCFKDASIFSDAELCAGGGGWGSGAVGKRGGGGGGGDGVAWGCLPDLLGGAEGGARGGLKGADGECSE